MTMKTTQVIAPLLSLALSLFLSSCGDEHHHHGEGHHHDAPHGGALIELGEHGTGFNLEMVHDSESGDLGIHVYDGHVSNPERIKQESIGLTVKVNGKEQAVSLAAVANPAFDESVGDTSFFQAEAALPGTLVFEGSVKSVAIKGRFFENIAFSYPSDDEHNEH